MNNNKNRFLITNRANEINQKNKFNYTLQLEFNCLKIFFHLKFFPSVNLLYQSFLLEL